MRTTHIRPVGPRNQVTIPAEILNTFRIKPHDLISFSRTDEGILMKPVVVVDKNEAWEKEELDALKKIIAKQVKAGEYVEFNTPKKALNSLRKKLRKITRENSHILKKF